MDTRLEPNIAAGTCSVKHTSPLFLRRQNRLQQYTQSCCVVFRFEVQYVAQKVNCLDVRKKS